MMSRHLKYTYSYNCKFCCHFFQEQYKDYDFENRLNFRIHAALNSLKTK